MKTSQYCVINLKEKKGTTTNGYILI